MTRRVLITGVQGQTGFYLAERLVAAGWDVHGTANLPPSGETQPGVSLHDVDLAALGSLTALLSALKPDLIVNLAAISSVAESWKSPTRSVQVNTLAVTEIAEYLSDTYNKTTRVVQASSSEIFGNSGLPKCDEETPIRPINPYGVSKAASHLLGQSLRAAGFNWSNAILYNHESPRRPITFLSRKVSSAVASISLGLSDSVELGDLSPSRDWGWAPDFAHALELIATNDSAEDFVVSTGIAHSVAEYVEAAFQAVGISNWREYVRTDAELIRPNEVTAAVGDSTKLRELTGWRPNVSFADMVSYMVDADLDRLSPATRSE